MMRILISVAFSSLLLLSACSGLNKMGKSTSTGIKEVEEKVVPVDPGVSARYNYFVIIGSFRDPVNAREYQEEISSKGFTPAILRNEAGLYRVSVLSTNQIEAARSEIRRIREAFPEHADTWLLIQKN